MAEKSQWRNPLNALPLSSPVAVAMGLTNSKPDGKGTPSWLPRNLSRAENGYRGAITEKEHYIYLRVILNMLIDDLLRVRHCSRPRGDSNE